MTAAGWYRDPYGTPGLLRWWDGRAWTDETLSEDDDRPSGDPGRAATATSSPTGSGGATPGAGSGAADDLRAGPAAPPDTAAGVEPGMEPRADAVPGAGADQGATEPHAGTSAAPAGAGADPLAGAGAASRAEPGTGTDMDAGTRPLGEPPAEPGTAPGSLPESGGATGTGPGAHAGAEPPPGFETQAWSAPGSGPAHSPWPPPPGAAPAGRAPAGAPSPEPAPGGPGQGTWPPPGPPPGPTPGPPPGPWPEAGQVGWPPPGQVPPPWQYPEPAWGAAPGGRRKGLVTLLIGGGVLLVLIIIVVVVALIATNVGGSTDKSGRSPVTATITDTKAGISYAGLGGGWRRETVSPTGGLGRLGFDQGEDAVVMKNYDHGSPYLASAYSGVAPGRVAGAPQITATVLLGILEPLSYPPHTRQILSSAAHTVDGHDGWLLKVRFDFPEAKSRGWNFRSETAVIMIIDRGSGQPPAEFYVSIPDSHKKQGDLDLLLSSLKVS